MAMMEARSGPASAPISPLEILLAVGIALWAVAILLHNDPGGLSFDPDSYMHLARFRDGIGIFHGGYFPRDNAPYGTVVPWTAPFDGALALFYAVGRLFADSPGALFFAARVVSPFFCATIGPIMFFGLRPFFSLRARTVIGGLAATAPQLVAFSLPGDADHHAMEVWLSVLFAVALIRYLFIDPARYRDAVATGIAAAVALWASPEEFIVVGSGLSALFLHRCLVVRPRAERAWAQDLALSGALAIALTAAWLVDPPYDGLWTRGVERLSVAYVSFAWLFASALLGLGAYLAKREAFSPPRNLIAAALLGGTAFLCWIAIAPNILGGPLGQVDRTVFGIVVDQTLEMLPMWWLTDWTGPHLVVLILIAAAFAVVIAKSSGRERWLWIAAAAFMVPITLLGIRYFRSIYYAEVFGSIPLGLVLAQRTRQYPKYMGYSAVALSMGVMLGVYSVAVLVWHQLQPSYQKFVATALAVCSLDNLAGAIAPIRESDAIVMTDLNTAPLVLYLSPRLRTVASPYIGNAEGVLDEFAFFRAQSDEAARAILDKRRVGFVLICATGKGERLEVFKDRIARETPAWLEPVGARDPQSGFRLFRVRAREG